MDFQTNRKTDILQASWELLLLQLLHIYMYINICVCVYIYRRRRWHPTPVLLPGKFHGRRSLVGCSPWGREESDMTEQLRFHFSLSCIGEGNGNPLQCSCLANPRDGGAWLAALYGVAQSWTWLKWCSSSSSRPFFKIYANINLFELHNMPIRKLLLL